MAERSEVRRFNVAFSEEAYGALQEIAAAQGKSLADVLRDALSLEKWLRDQQKEGNRILVEEEDGKTREVVFR